MKSKKISFEKLSYEALNPILGGAVAASASTTGKNQTTSSGADNDSKGGDQDTDFVDSAKQL